MAAATKLVKPEMQRLAALLWSPEAPIKYEPGSDAEHRFELIAALADQPLS